MTIERETQQAQSIIREARFRVTDVCLVILTLLAVMYTLYFAASIILPLVLALVLSLLLAPAARFLCNRLRLPRMLAAAGADPGSVLGHRRHRLRDFGAGTGWIAKAPQSLPTLEKKLSFLRRPIDMFQGGMQQMQKADERDGAGRAGQRRQGRPAPAQKVTVSQSFAAWA